MALSVGSVRLVLKDVLGSASTKEVVISLQPGIGTRGSRLIVFVQDPRSGHILAVAAQKL